VRPALASCVRTAQTAHAAPVPLAMQPTAAAMPAIGPLVAASDVSASMPPRRTPAVSFDHLVGDGEQVRRNGKAECLCGFEVDAQLHLCDLLHR
jgi:hypothetical protein